MRIHNMSTFINVLRRNGSVTPYDGSKIRKAIDNAAKQTEQLDQHFDNAVYNAIKEDIFKKINVGIIKHIDGIKQNLIDVEDIQDIVEKTLITYPEINNLAINYIRYRHEHKLFRKGEFTDSKLNSIATIKKDDIKNRVEVDGIEYTQKQIHDFYEYLLGKIPEGNKVDLEMIINEFFKSTYKNMSYKDFEAALMLAPRCFIEEDPVYDVLAANVLNTKINKEVLGESLVGTIIHPKEELTFLSDNKYLVNYNTFVASSNLFSDEYKDFINHLYKQNTEKATETDNSFEQLVMLSILTNNHIFSSNIKLLGLQTLYDRYLVRDPETQVVKELPVFLFMRVAYTTSTVWEDGVATLDKEQFLLSFRSLCSFDFMNSTPTLFNSGLKRQQLSSCYVSTIPDDLEGIYDGIRDYALMSKYAGGIGTDWTPVRALGSLIKGTNGLSQGVVPFLKVVNDTAVAVNQGGKRKGAICSYLETWHLDIEEFLELRKNTGDDRRRTHDMNTANWIPDLFMERVKENGKWTLFSPSDVPDLHDLFGENFKARYQYYEELAEKGKIKLFKQVEAVSLWRKMLGMLYETGHPWITFKDAFNYRNPQRHHGVIHSSNLCTEIGLVNSNEEIAVCNLGSINLVNHVKQVDGKYEIDVEKLKQTTKQLVFSLDAVIDNNFYPVKQAKTSNLRSRPIGLGIMGLQDVCYLMGIPFDEVNPSFQISIMKPIYVEAIKASHELAMKYGAYPTFVGSDWSKGVLPHDTYRYMNKNQETLTSILDMLDNDEEIIELRTLVKKGMRNCCLLSIAPTATIANITGVVPSIEPTYRNLYVKSNLSGEFTVYNPYLVQKLKELYMWNDDIKSYLKQHEGSVTHLEGFPDELKQLFKTSFECDQEGLIMNAAIRQLFIDQAQSLNLYVSNPSGKKLDSIYKLAWSVGLKSTYYLRTTSASRAEMSTGITGQLNQVTIEEPKFCSIDNPDCESCQ